MSDDKKLDLKLIIKIFLVFLLISTAMVFVFAAVIYFLEGGYEYSPLFATISVAVGCFAAAFVAGLKLKRKGILIGFAVGFSAFMLITLAALLVNSSAIGLHTLLRLFIMLLCAFIGGVLGVNRNTEPKYI